MRISDWSSDVCSSDLFGIAGAVVDRSEDLAHALRRVARHRTIGKVGYRLAQRQQGIALAVLLNVEIGQLAQQRELEEVAAPGKAQALELLGGGRERQDRKSTRLNSSH